MWARRLSAFLGRARRGPVDEPVALSSFADFERAFGGLWAPSALTYAVRDFFLNGGSQAVVVRVYAPPASGGGSASLTIAGLQVEAIDPGTWGNAITATVDDLGITDEVAASLGVARADLFNLTVQAEGTTERFTSVTAVAGPRQADVIVGRQSHLVRVTLAGAGAGDVHDVAPVTASGGDDGEAIARRPGSSGAGTRRQVCTRLEKVDLFNLLCIPPDDREGDTPVAVYQEAMRYCAERRAILLVDPPHGWDPLRDGPQDVVGAFAGPDARNAAIYFPRIVAADPLARGDLATFVPSGAVAGVIARTDAQRGVWKAPAGLDAAARRAWPAWPCPSPTATTAVSTRGASTACALSRGRHGGVGRPHAAGAPTNWPTSTSTSPFGGWPSTWRRASHAALAGPSSSPTTKALWSQLRLNIGSFMHNLFRQGAFQGTTPAQAYFVKCDSETTSQQDIGNGVVNILVGFAPLRPAEFVVITLQQAAGQLQAQA